MIIQLSLFDGKICRKCGWWYPIEMFDLAAHMPDGHIHTCKNCTKAYRASRGSLAYESVKRWRQENRERFMEHHRSYSREYHARRYVPRPRPSVSEEQQRANRHRLSQEWDQRNPERRQAIRQAYRARRRLATGTVIAAEWRALCEYYDNRCLCCGVIGSLTMDHVVPLSKGGTHTIDNVQPLCGKCNSRKRDKVIDYRPSSQNRDYVIR